MKGIQRIFIDMDYVICDNLERFQEWYERDYGVRIADDQLRGKKYREAVPDEHREAVTGYPYLKGFHDELAPRPGSLQVVEALHKQYEVFIASAAMEFPLSLIDKKKWMAKYLPSIPWQRIIFCGSKDILKGDLLIDDNAYNLDAFDGAGLFFEAHHNLGQEGYDRVADWEAVRERLL